MKATVRLFAIHLVLRDEGGPRKVVCRANGNLRGAGDPVAVDRRQVGANIDTAEAEVVVAEVAVVEDLAPAVDDLVVITNFASRVAAEVPAEATETAVELLESNDLSLDFTDGLSDDSL